MPSTAILAGAHSYFVVSPFKCEGKNSCHDLIPNPHILREKYYHLGWDLNLGFLAFYASMWPVPHPETSTRTYFRIYCNRINTLCTGTLPTEPPRQLLGLAIMFPPISVPLYPWARTSVINWWRRIPSWYYFKEWVIKNVKKKGKGWHLTDSHL